MRVYYKIWNETTWGTFANPGAPVKNTDYILLEVNESNALTLTKKPKQQQIATANAGNRVQKVWSVQHDVTGNATTLAYPEQMPFLANWAAVLSAGELPSCTIDKCVVMDDDANTPVYTRYLGVKVQQFQIETSAENPGAKVTMQLIGKTTANITGTDFPAPAQSEFPAGLRPYCFTDLVTPGALVLGSTRSTAASVTLTIENTLNAPFFMAEYVGKIRWCGRRVSLNTRLQYDSAADRTAYEGTTAQTASLKFDNGVNSFLIDLKSGNYITEVNEDLSMDTVFYQDVNFVNTFNGSAGTDLSITTS